MSSLELIITNAPPKSVRARYRKESRGFITGENGKKVQLQVRNNTGKEWCFDGAKCTGEVKSVATKQPHSLYSLRKSIWDVTIEKNGSVKVDLDHLAVEINSGRNQKQKSDKGEFYLEFKLKFAENNPTPDLICRTDDMLDTSCKETCKPKIKGVNPQCATGGDEVWIQCTSDVAKINKVEAIFSGMIGSLDVHFPVEGRVDGKVVKIVMPCQYDDCIADITKLQLRLRVNKNENIVSDPVTFGYLPKRYYRPKITDCNEEVSNLRRIENSRTFQTHALIELNTDSGVGIALIPPKGMSNPSNLRFDGMQSLKAFQDTKNQCLAEKAQNTFSRRSDIASEDMLSTGLGRQIKETANVPTMCTTNEVTILNQIKSKILPETNASTELQHNTELVNTKALPSTVIPVERPQKRKPLIMQPPDDAPREVILQTHRKTIQDFENSKSLHFGRAQTVTGTNTCPVGITEELSPTNLSASTAKKDIKNQQKGSASMVSRNEQVSPTQAVVSPNHNLNTGSLDTCPVDVAEDLAFLSVSGAEDNFNDLQDCSMPSTSMDQSTPVPDYYIRSPTSNLTAITNATEKYVPENITTLPAIEENLPRSCFAPTTFKNEEPRLVLNHYDDPSTSKSNFNYPGNYYQRPSSSIGGIDTRDSKAANFDAWMKELNRQNVGGRDIFKEIESEGADTTMDTNSISDHPVANNPNPNYDPYGHPRAKIRKLY